MTSKIIDENCTSVAICIAVIVNDANGGKNHFVKNLDLMGL